MGRLDANLQVARKLAQKNSYHTVKNMQNIYSLSAYDFELPSELIAQYPCEPRDHSRLMIVDRKSGHLDEIRFCELADFLQKDDSLVFNNTKVIPARLFGKRQGGGETEILLLRQLVDGSWNVMARPGRKLPLNSSITFGPDFSCQIVEVYPNGTRRVMFNYQKDFNTLLTQYGTTPLPPYIKRDADPQFDPDRYQTVYAAEPGAVAAPTAGLHFTQKLLEKLSNKGVSDRQVTLHVGQETFRPVMTEDIRDHQIHQELFSISEHEANEFNKSTRIHRQICVGTTSCRVLESAVNEKGEIESGTRESSLFIYPGYQFKYVRSLMTNFHFPRSTLLMLVSAFAGYDLIQEAYAKAIEKRFRFFSYGDAMLIL
jgi:S-adenosylmethionine:tRNA ribosyltransferase-isomerase